MLPDLEFDIVEQGEDDLMAVAKQAGAIIASMELEWDERHDAWYLDFIFVVPQWRRQRVASSLEQYARQRLDIVQPQEYTEAGAAWQAATDPSFDPGEVNVQPDSELQRQFPRTPHWYRDAPQIP